MGATIGLVAEGLIAVAASQAVGELDGGFASESVDADDAEVVVATADVLDGAVGAVGAVGSGATDCLRSAGLVPAESVVPVARAAVGQAGPAVPAAV